MIALQAPSEAFRMRAIAIVGWITLARNFADRLTEHMHGNATWKLLHDKNEERACAAMGLT